eukprot:6572999-Ditylum_brightwellii.AAC.1
MEKEFQKNMGQFLSGMKHTVAKEKAQSGQSLSKRKKYITFEVYSKFCEILMRGKGDDYLFAHTFLALEWNLPSQSDNCFAMYLNHIEWADDCLFLYFGT